MICLCFGIMAGCFQLFWWRDEKKVKGRESVLVFYSFVFYGVLSLAKTILGDADITLFESFSDISIRTYCHYALLLFPIALILPVIMNIVLKKDRMRILYMYDSWVFMLCAICFAVTGIVNNLMYISILFVSLVLTFVFAPKKSAEDNFRLKINYIVPNMAFWVMTVMIYIPGEIYLNNVWEFRVAPLTYTRIILSAFVCFAIYTVGTICLLTTKQSKILSRIIFVLTFLGYLQNMFLNGHMSAMDGTRQVWTSGKIQLNAIIWIVVILCAAAAEKLVHRSLDRVYKTVCIYISIVEFVSLIIMVCMAGDLAESQKLYGSQYVQLTREGICELASDDNVIIFVLDWYDEQILEQILTKDSEFLKPLEGFTHYSNASSLYAYTKMSVPYLLTGVEWKYNMSEHEYCQYAFADGNMLQDIKDAGYDAGIYTDSVYLTEEAMQSVSNHNMFHSQVDACRQLYVMTNIARYQMAPFVLKKYFWYEPQNLQDMIVAHDDVYIVDSVKDDMKLYNELITSGLQINDNRQKSFRFIHLYGAHPPCGIDESGENPYNAAMLSQAHDAMNIVFEYVEQMKKLGVYDTATIIITADHGENYLYDPDNKGELLKLGLEDTSNPILLVKNSKCDEKGINYSKAPVSHREVVAEIMRTVDPSLKKYGNSLCEIDEDADLKREFIFKRGDQIYVEAFIDGNIRDRNNWKVMEYE